MQGLKVFPPPAATLANIIFLAGKVADQAAWPSFSHPGSQSWCDAKQWLVVLYYVGGA